MRMAPDFELPDLSGEPWKLSEALKNGPVLLVFFKVSCPTCQLTLPFLERFDSPQVIAVSQDDAAGTRGFGTKLRTVLDTPRTYPVSNAYGITHVPALFLVESDGRISDSVEGFSKANLEKWGARFGVAPFHPGEQVPALRPG
jgi:peroxiredoxin